MATLLPRRRVLGACLRIAVDHGLNDLFDRAVHHRRTVHSGLKKFPWVASRTRPGLIQCLFPRFHEIHGQHQTPVRPPRVL
jgi:hypothetical protein